MLLPVLLALLALNAASATVQDAAEGMQPWLVKTRRDLHRIPELGFQEHLTAQYIKTVLKDLNITFM